MQVLYKGIKNSERKRIDEILRKQEIYFNRLIEKIFKITRLPKTTKKEKPRAEIFFEVKKEVVHHQKRPYFYAEAQIKIGRNLFRAEGLKENLESSIIEVKEKLIRKLKQYKTKLAAKYERGARKLKRELKISELAKKKEGKRVLREGI